ncbi:23S rRNA (pseudouridine(1915)-N(3))-methyltransferase RlmH [Rhabdaerophilum sp. SD176]|uniref:23S rRNA (pseudouridine(1915)-N(3))-methyltransferase RlmH n=1 Tax=Rhabdaerophilum sp. SD176 TaxID=2983548 RepID=UPI0024E01D6C|nr:23S rRNA (pseudouridine(1915)-N(3))-methyltransferase RlmH [Rhabdaerophilum sp. SD176]
MKLDVLAIGRLKAGPERDLVMRYAERLKGLGRGIGLDGPRLVELAESPARRDLDRKQEEARALVAEFREGYRLVLFDERGAALDSGQFAAMLGEWRDSGVPGASFVIGGADGLDPALRERAAKILAFGAMTLPHQLVRVLVLEQIYRAGTILSGHPYHRN